MLTYVRATSLTPAGPPDWVNMPLTIHAECDYFSLAEVAGAPALVYISEPAPGTYEIRYAYGNMPVPDDATDWTSTAVTAAIGPGEWYLVSWLMEHDSLPAFTLWSSPARQTAFARASTATPTGLADWVISPICDADTGGANCALIDCDGQPLVVYETPLGDYLNCTVAVDWTADSLEDWQPHLVDNESAAPGRKSIAQLPDGVGVAYRNLTPPESLMFAWFEGGPPEYLADWCVMQVVDDVGPNGFQAVAVLPDGRPAIAYGDEDDSQVRLTIMDPPE